MSKKPKLYSLTEEHRVQLKPWADRWIANAVRTGPYTELEKDNAREAVAKLYAAAGLLPPKNIVFADGPVSAALAAGISAGVWYYRKNPGCLGQATEQATEQATRQATYQATAQATYQATEQATEQAPCSDSALVQLLVRCAGNPQSMRSGGNQWSGWVAYLSFFRHVAKLPLDYSKFDSYETLTKFGPRFEHPDFCIISALPDELHRDARGLAHHPSKPYCTWPDGVKLYYWHGVEVPSEWILNPSSVDPASALTWPNIEQRRALCEILGWAKVLEHCKPTVVDKHTNPEIGTLLEVDLPEAGKCRFLKVLCGTKREFVLAVPVEVKTALEAQAWTYNINPAEFAVEVRT